MAPAGTIASCFLSEHSLPRLPFSVMRDPKTFRGQLWQVEAWRFALEGSGVLPLVEKQSGALSLPSVYPLAYHCLVRLGVAPTMTTSSRCIGIPSAPRTTSTSPRCLIDQTLPLIPTTAKPPWMSALAAALSEDVRPANAPAGPPRSSGTTLLVFMVLKFLEITEW